MAKNRRLPLILLFLVLTVALFYAAIALGTNRQAFERFFTPSKTASSWSVLEGIRSLNELESAVYKMKVVFPFDFAGDAEEANWKYLKKHYDSDRQMFVKKSNPAWHPDGILAPEWQHAEIYALSRQIGIDPGRPDYRFVVISVSISAGVDVDAWLNGFEGAPDELKGIRVGSDEEGKKWLAITAPPIEIISFVVHDLDASADGYPDVALSPESWGILVSNLLPRLQNIALSHGLLEAAEEQSRAFFTKIFNAAGYYEVKFTE